MRITQRNLRSRRRRVYFCFLVAFCLVVGTIVFEEPRTGAAARSKGPISSTDAPTAVFPANPGSLGPIPDGPAPCGTAGAPLNVTFNVTGLTAPLTDIRVNLTMNPAHTWVFDIDAILFSPSGTASHFIWQEINDSSDIAGPYTFHDGAPASPTFPEAAAAAAATAPIPSGDYRTSNNAGANTLMLPAFSGLSTAQLNGTWTLRFVDFCPGDTGTVSAANLTLTGAAAAPAQHVVDTDGDGKTDQVVIRAESGASDAKVNWFLLEGAHARPGEEAPAAAVRGFQWGIASDQFLMEDFDGDNKSDLAVFRPGAPGNSFWYILNSSNATVDIINFGQAGDDATVVGDYDGDGKADVAVYRGGSPIVGEGAPGQSNWWYRKSSVGGAGCTPANCVNIQWGQGGDFPAPGDYDGDGKNDFVVQRDNGGGLARFWILEADGPMSSVLWGTPTDNVVPGDYDADGKTDIAVVRSVSGQWAWFIRNSSAPGPEPGFTPTGYWGASGTDFLTQGDYDGDGKTDLAVWRISTGQFFYNGSTSGPRGLQWGATGDYPIANFNVH